MTLCSWVKAQFSAQSEKLKGWLIRTDAIGGVLLKWQTIEVMSISAPGVVGRWGIRGLEDMIERFRIGHFGLAGWFVVDGVRQGLTIVEDGDFCLGILANGNLCIAQGVIGASGLDLVDDLVELDGQVLGKGTGLLMAEDEVQVFGFEQGPMSIMGAAGRHAKTAVVIFSELGQIGVARLHV